MSDLIRREDVIKLVNQFVFSVRKEQIYESKKAFIKYIEKMPTAYSVGKVVEELKTDSSVKLYGSGNSDNYLIPVKRAIEIVKQGGVSDDVCEWKYNDSEYYFESSCKHLHIFMSDGPKENEYSFCPYCGKKIKVVE